MKHAFWDRVLIILCTILLLGLAALMLGMIVGLIPVAAVIQQLNGLLENRTLRILCSVAAVALVILAALAFCIVLPRRKARSSSFAIQETEHGALKISVKALDHLVQKCVAQHPELTVVSSAIHSDEETVHVDLRCTLQSDINIPLAISSLQKQIKQYVEACSGVEVDAVRVVVEATVAPVAGVHSPFAIPEMMQPQLPKLIESSAPAAVLEPAPIAAEAIVASGPEVLPETEGIRAAVPDPLSDERVEADDPLTRWEMEQTSEAQADDDHHSDAGESHAVVTEEGE